MTNQDKITAFKNLYNGKNMSQNQFEIPKKMYAVDGSCNAESIAKQQNNSCRRYICKSNKDAESASSRFFGRACERKIYKKMYAVQANIIVELLGNHQNSDSLYIKALIEDI